MFFMKFLITTCVMKRVLCFINVLFKLTKQQQQKRHKTIYTYWNSNFTRVEVYFYIVLTKYFFTSSVLVLFSRKFCFYFEIFFKIKCWNSPLFITVYEICTHNSTPFQWQSFFNTCRFKNAILIQFLLQISTFHRQL